MTSKEDWMSVANALAHSVRRYSYQVGVEMQKASLNPSPYLQEKEVEVKALMGQTWNLYRKECREHEIEDAIKVCNDDDIIRALEHLEGTSETFSYTPGVTKNDYIIRLAMNKGWEPFPEPTDAEMELTGEPPLSAEERIDIAWKEKLYAKG